MATSGTIRLAAEAHAEAEANLAVDRQPCGTVDLIFSDHADLSHVDDPIWKDVSCIAVAGRSIFCSCDETASVERLTLDPGTGEAGGHQSFALADAFDLPDGRMGEMDIEGLDIAGGYLWICGSHSLKRDDPDEDGLAAMQDIDWDPNRAFLGRVPLIDRGGGAFAPVVGLERFDDRPARASRALRTSRSRDKAPIRKMLAKDPLIGPFVDLPCKENGLDIEGLAVRGETVLLGLRGPVIGGLAMLIRLELKEKGDDRMKPRKLDVGRRYALQAVDLNGQGIRDMTWHGDRLLILSGATTDLEALQSVFAIEDYDPGRALFAGDDIGRVLDLPVVRGADHAEGIAIVEDVGTDRLLVTHDSPREDRTDAKRQRLTADLFEIAHRPRA